MTRPLFPSAPSALTVLACIFLGFAAQSAHGQRIHDLPRELSLGSALAAALSGSANVLQSQVLVEGAQGAAQQQRGAFDFNLNAQAGDARNIQPLRESVRQGLLAGGYDLRYQLTDATTIQAGASQLFMNGVQASVVSTVINTWDNLYPVNATQRQATGILSFQLRLPLLRTSGGAASAPLRAAEIETEATRGELEFTVSQTLLSSTLAYWDYLAKARRLAIHRANERRGEDLLDELRKLIEADEVPAAEINLARASLNDRRSARIAAEQALLESRRALGRTLGLEARAAMAIGELADAFPEYDGSPVNAVARMDELTLRAMDARSDLYALRRRHDAAQVRLDAARGNERPQLDFVLGATQNGLSEGASPAALSAAYANRYDPGYSAALVFQMPLDNNAALGASRQQAALVAAQRIRVNELGHSISNSIETASYSLLRTTEILKEADAAVRTYAVSLENERIKRRLGTSTLIDVLNIEDRYHNALLAAVQARQGYAGAIAQFRFETSALLSRDGDTYRARVSDLLTHAVR